MVLNVVRIGFERQNVVSMNGLQIFQRICSVAVVWGVSKVPAYSSVKCIIMEMDLRWAPQDLHLHRMTGEV